MAINERLGTTFFGAALLGLPAITAASHLIAG
jgi:hypothetical protein